MMVTTLRPADLRTHTVLCVDDVAENLSMLNSLLRGSYKVRLATNGEQAIELAERTAPDLILLDVVMQGMDGYEVCRRLKQNQQTADIPVIFLTALNDEQDEQHGFDLGAVDYITKPLSPPILLSRVKAQLFLKEARDALERRNREEKARFELALAQQIELNSLKSSFVSMTSHEFRTPLTAVLSSNEMLRHYADRLSTADKAAMYDQIDGAVKRMLGMLDQMLTIGRAEAQGLQFRPNQVHLRSFCDALVHEAQSAHSPAAGHPVAQVRIDLQVDEVFELDEKLLRHVLGNLLSNAIKYSPMGGDVRFTVAREGAALKFEVADQGIGIPDEDLPRLFGNFHRASNVSGIPGTGLGLSIVKRAVEAHGGQISVHSEAGRGTTFTVLVPLAQ